MSKKNIKIYESLPIIDLKNNHFSSLNKDKSKKRIIDLINTDIIFEVKNLTMKTFQHSYGKLLAYNDNCILIKPYDYIQNQEENIKINIKNIIGIEQYNASSTVSKNTFINHACKIIDRDDNNIVALIRNFSEFEIEFQFKYQDNGEEFIGAGAYPICLIKEIQLV